MSTTTVDPTILVEGYGLRSAEEFDALPPGTVIVYPGIGGGRTYTKEPTGRLWKEDSTGQLRDPRDHFVKNGENVIKSLPRVLRVGDKVPNPSGGEKGKVFADLPIGTTVRCHVTGDKTLTKVGENEWKDNRRGFTSRRRRDTWFAADADHEHTIESLPDGVTVLTLNSLMGQKAISSVGELAGLDAGTFITVEQLGHGKVTWTTIGDGMLKMNNGGAELPAVHFERPIANGYVTIGVTPESGQCYSRDNTTYLLVDHDAAGWWMAVWARERWSGVVAQPEPIGTLVTQPEWLTDVVKRTAQAAVTFKRQLDASVANNADLTAKVAEAEAAGLRLRSAFSHIEKGKVEPDDLRTYIDSVLSENGIKTLDQTVTVTATIRIAQYLTIPAEALREHIPGLEKGETVSVEAGRQLITYDRDFEREFDVEPGNCGCVLFNNDSMRQVVREAGLIDLYSHTIMSRRCTSETCRYKPKAEPDPF
jgi:hypothetical protein